jgi:hypothetical protein
MKMSRIISVYKSLPIQAENKSNLQIYRTTIHCIPIPADANPDGKEGCLIASKIIKESEKHLVIFLLSIVFCLFYEQHYWMPLFIYCRFVWRFIISAAQCSYSAAV